MSASGDGEPTPTREQQIIARIGQIREELGALMRELTGEGDEEDSPEKRRKALRLLKGAGILVLIAASLGMAHAASWTARHARTVAGAAVGAGAAGVIAGALLAHSAPPPRHGSIGPIPHPSSTPSISASASVSASAPSSASPKERTRPPLPVPLPVVSRSRKPSAAASGAAAGPVGPSPTPGRPSPSPTATSPPPTPIPPAPPFTCPAGLILRVIGIGVYVCV